MPVEALFPQGRRLHSSSPPPVGRGSWGLMPLTARHTASSPIRAVLRWLPEVRPDWLGFTLAGVVLDLVGELGDQLRSFCQVVAPDRMGMKR